MWKKKTAIPYRQWDCRNIKNNRQSRRLRRICFFLKMLIVFAVIPISAPGKAMFREKPVAEIVFVYLVGEGLGAVSIAFRADRRYLLLPVLIGDIRIEKRIDINGKSAAMHGNPICACDGAVIKAGSIVVLHGKQIVGPVFIHQADLLDLIVCLVELIKNFNKILCNGLVADNISRAGIAFEIDI